jgi:hypothetical protein
MKPEFKQAHVLMVVHAIGADADRPGDDLISAVFLIALQGDNILSVRNERGWDIPAAV